MTDVLIVGSIAFDTIRTPFGKVVEELGGSATHFSIAAGFFTSVRLVAVVGNDFPKKHERFLKDRRVDLSGLEHAKGKTFRWKGYYDFNLNEAHTEATDLNVFAKFNPKIPDEYKDSKFVFLGNIDPNLQLKVLDQIKKPDFIACDTMNFWIEGNKKALMEVVKKVDLMLLNDGEVRQLTNEPNVIKAALKILKKGPRYVIVKKGENGALLFSKKESFAMPAFPLESVYDPTGAGDSFGGGFTGYLARLEDADPDVMRKAMVYGSVMASYNVEKFGTHRVGSLTLREIESRYRAFERLTTF